MSLTVASYVISCLSLVVGIRAIIVARNINRRIDRLCREIDEHTRIANGIFDTIAQRIRDVANQLANGGPNP